MEKIISLFIGIFILFILPIDAETWRGIVPLKSTRSDVEKLIGKPKQEITSMLYVYRVEDAEVTIKYTNRQMCIDSHSCECQVPDNTVSEVVVRQKKQFSFGSVDTAKWNFDKIPNAENALIMNYFDRSAGILYSVDTRSDRVLYVQYGVAEKDCLEMASKPSID